MRGHTPCFQNGRRHGPGFKEYLSEIPCLVTGLPASGATPMKNPAYNGGTQLPKGGVIPWEVGPRLSDLTP